MGVTAKASTATGRPGAESPGVRLEVDGAVGTLVLDRPPVNALSARVQEALHQAADEATRRSDVRAVVIRGENGVLSAGADIREMAEMSAEDMAKQAVRLQAAFRAVAEIPKPVVAAIEGYALGGGCELALAADHRICAADASIGLPEILLGVIPGAGGTQRLTRLVGPAKAKQLIFTGARLSAADAQEIGLVDRVVPCGEVVQAAREWAENFIDGPAAALRAAKAAIDGGLGRDLASALELETDLFAALFATEDRLIGMRAFLDKAPGKPKFTGC